MLLREHCVPLHPKPSARRVLLRSAPINKPSTDQPLAEMEATAFVPALGPRSTLGLNERPGGKCRSRLDVRATLSDDNRVLKVAGKSITGQLPTSVARPKPQEVATRMVEVEAERKRAKARTDISLLTSGQWRVCAINPKRKKRSGPLAALPADGPYYFPVRAQQTITFGSDDEGTFNNGVFWGPLSFRLIGPARWVPERNRMEFTFAKAELRIGPFGPFNFDAGESSIAGKTAKDLPFFTWFYVDDEIAMSRGRTGGMALYAKVPPGEEL